MRSTSKSPSEAPAQIAELARADWPASPATAIFDLGQNPTLKLRAVQYLLGHTKLESTVRYLGIGVDDALAISDQVDLSFCQGRCVCRASHRSWR